MTPAETPDAHRKPPVRRWLWNFIVFGVVACMLGVGILFHQQRSYQDCVARYLAVDSQARQVRGQSSQTTINAIVRAFDAISAGVKPNYTPTPAQVKEFVDSVAAVDPAAHANDEAIKAHPYYDFREICG